jgi:hypothetical protein
MGAAAKLRVADCAIWLRVPEPSEWQHIGNQIKAAFIFAWANRINVLWAGYRRTSFPYSPLFKARRYADACLACGELIGIDRPQSLPEVIVVLPQHRFYFLNFLLAAHADEEHVHH